MKYLQILTVDKEYFSINLAQQIYIKVSADDTEVCFYSRSYQLVFTTNEKSTRGAIISPDTMYLLQNAVLDEVEIYTHERDC
jgi:hypothetical protein